MIILILTDPMIATGLFFIVGVLIRMIGGARSSLTLKTMGELMVVVGGCGFIAACVANHNIFYNFGNDNVCFTVGDLQCLK